VRSPFARKTLNPTAARGTSGATQGDGGFSSVSIKQRERRRDDAFEERPFRADPRQNTYSHEHGQEMMSQILRRYRARNRAPRLTCLDALQEELLDATKYAGDDLLELRVMGRNLER